MKYIFESLNKAKQFIKIKPEVSLDDCISTNGNLMELSNINYGITVDNLNLYLEQNVKQSRKKIYDSLKNIDDDIMILTDADFEGERIAYDIKNIINKDNIYRAWIKSYTKNGIEKAYNNNFKYNDDNIKKYNIDKILRIQKLRRIIDRLIGFAISERLSYTGFLSGTGRGQIALLTAIKNMELLKVKNNNFYKPIALYNKNYNTVEVHANYGKSYSLATLSDLLVTARHSKVAYTYLQNLYETGAITYIRTDNNQMSEDYAKYLDLKVDNNLLIDVNKMDGFFPHEGIRFSLEFLDFLCSIKEEDKILKYLNETYMQNFLYNTDNISYKYNEDFFTLFKNISLFSYRNKFEDIYNIETRININNSTFLNRIYTIENDIDLHENSRIVTEPIKTERDMVFVMNLMGSSAPSTYVYTINKLFEKKLIIKQNSTDYVLSKDGSDLYNILSKQINLNKYTSTKYKDIIYNGVISEMSDLEILNELLDYYNIKASVFNKKLLNLEFKKENFDFSLDYLDKYKTLEKTKNKVVLMI